MRVVIFLGPSLPLAEAAQVLDAIYLPPAGQADILSAIRIHKPDVIGLIDGTFLQTLSVWHKEILYALEAGIRVYGASSMGALRAAETADYGMVGVGEIYRMFASGELNDDDEVALAHAHREDGYTKLSEPMVNVRATFQKAHEEGVVDAQTLSTLIACAKDLYFPDRTFPAILQRAAAAGVAAPDLAHLKTFVARSYVDLKRRDAIEMLETIRDLPAALPNPKPEFALCRSYLFQTLYDRDRRVRHDDTELALASIANHAALNLETFGTLNFAAMNRMVALLFASMVGISATPDAIAEETTAYRARHRLTADEDFLAWRERNDLTPEEFTALMTEVATCRRLHRWMLSDRFLDKSAHLILDELRLNDQYTASATRAAFEQRVMDAYFPDFNAVTMADTPLNDLVREHLETTRCSMDRPYPVWAADAGFHSTEDLRKELVRARQIRSVMRSIEATLMDAAQPPEERPAPASGNELPF